jgi:hypothetical protein
VSRHYIDISQRLAKAKNRWAVFLWRKNAKIRGEENKGFCVGEILSILGSCCQDSVSNQ